MIVPHFARAAACLLLLAAAAAKPGKSTLDTKKDYKTKTGSTSSVTLTLEWLFWSTRMAQSWRQG